MLNGYNDLLSQDNFHFSCTENINKFWEDELEVRDNHVSIELKNRDLIIQVFIPEQDPFMFHYVVTGKVWDRNLD